MQGIVTKIRQNGGIIYDKPVNGKNYLVLNDSDKNIEHVKKYISPGKDIEVVSYRWVTSCIIKNTLINLDL